VTKQTTPHTQTQQNANPQQDDLESQAEDLGMTASDLEIYQNMDGAETGTNRTPKKLPAEAAKHNVVPAPVAFEGETTTRTPQGSGQGITSQSSTVESERQQKVVEERPDAQAGLNHAESDRKAS
jgi:hypothetical protein